MTTVTSLTADRMLAIEAASVVDGDVVGDNLILTKHDGSQINAGSVRGPTGSPGPVGQDLPILTAAPILDVGVSGQIRAGRQLTAADFTAMGLSAPLGLWNLSDLTDVSGNGRNLLNKGAVPFGTGINGSANTAAQFSGSTAQALYISDTGVADPFRIKAGSCGAWVKTGKPGSQQSLMSKLGGGGAYGWDLFINPPNNQPGFQISVDGSNIFSAVGVSNVCDDHWHFVVGTADGSLLRLYVDGLLEAVAIIPGLIFATPVPFNVGSRQGDSGNPSVTPNYGRIDEAFVTSDILSEDQVRNLYCAKIPHTLAAIPSRVSLNVHRRRKGAALAVADFPTQPLRLYNFSGGSLGDEGSNGQLLADTSGAGGSAVVAGADGSSRNSFALIPPSTYGLVASDAGLPAGLNPRSFGSWFKTTDASLSTHGVMAWCGPSTQLLYVNSGVIDSANGADYITGPFVADGQWHFVVMVENNTAADNVKRKMYLDGRLVGASMVMNSISLVGGTSFHLGSNSDSSNVFAGQIDGAFVCDYALTFEQIAKLYSKSLMTLGSSPKSSGDHVEVMTANSLLATFDTIDSQNSVDLLVAA